MGTDQRAALRMRASHENRAHVRRTGWRVLAAFRPPPLLIYIATDDGRVPGTISARVAGRRHNIAGGIRIVGRVRCRRRASRFSRILRERILTGEPVAFSRTGCSEDQHYQIGHHSVMRRHL